MQCAKTPRYHHWMLRRCPELSFATSPFMPSNASQMHFLMLIWIKPNGDFTNRNALATSNPWFGGVIMNQLPFVEHDRAVLSWTIPSEFSSGFQGRRGLWVGPRAAHSRAPGSLPVASPKRALIVPWPQPHSATLFTSVHDEPFEKNLFCDGGMMGTCSVAVHYCQLCGLMPPCQQAHVPHLVATFVQTCVWK